MTGISTEDQDASMSFRVCVIRSERITSSSAGTRGRSYRRPVCTISLDPVPNRVRFSRRIRPLSARQPINKIWSERWGTYCSSATVTTERTAGLEDSLLRKYFAHTYATASSTSAPEMVHTKNTTNRIHEIARAVYHGSLGQAPDLKTELVHDDPTRISQKRREYSRKMIRTI